MTPDQSNGPAVSWSIPSPLGTWITSFFDEDSFLSLGHPAAAPDTQTLIAGVGQVNGQSVACASVSSLSVPSRRVIDRVIALARQTGCPIILVSTDQPPVAPLDELHGPFSSIEGIIQLSGVVPIITVEIGACGETQKLIGALSDFRILVGPKGSGAYSYVTDELKRGCAWIRDLLARLPQNNCEFATANDLFGPYAAQDLAALLPNNPVEPYDVLQILDALSDDEPLCVEGQGSALASAFIRLGGRSVGVLASQPAHHGGIFGPDEARKAARFLRLCDAFNMPLLCLVDAPGHSTQIADDQSAYAQLAHATAAASIPIVTVLLRRAHGFAAAVLGAKSLGVDVVLAWPSASLSPAGLHRVVNSLLPEGASDSQRADALERHRTRSDDLERQTNDGLIDHVIDPNDTPQILARWFAALENKRKQGPSKKHGNLPL
jgi:acetyl-CoA carboxylase carboxyltransferase component